MKSRYLKKASAVFAALIAISIVFQLFAPNFAAHAAFDILSGSNCTIESDPPRLSSPGYVTIIIKLHNVNGSNEGNYIGADDEPGANSRPTEPPATEEPTAAPTDEPTQPPVDETPTPPDETVPPVVPGGGAYTNISIVNSYDVTFSTYDIPAGGTGVFRGSMYISEDKIGVPLAFTIYWRDEGSGITYYKNLSVTVSRSDTAYLRLTRTASTTSAAIGETVELTYTMVNTGSRRLNNITLIDEKIGGNRAMLTPFSLASGEKKEFTFTYTMQGASVVSKPTATFTPEGSSTPLSVTISKITIGLINAQLSKTVTMGNSTPEGVQFTLFLTNNGSQNLSGLTVRDDLGAVLASGFSLAIGESKIIEYFVPNPESIRNVFFDITGTYSSGMQFKDNTTSYTVRPYIDPNSLGLKFHVEIVKQLNSDNHIVLEFNVVNTGRVPYTDVTVTEKELGYNLHEIAELKPSAAGESFNVDLTIDGPREMVFYLDAVDPSGNSYRYEAIVNAEYADFESAIPSVTPEPGEGDGISIVDQGVDKHIGDIGTKLMKWWRTLEVIFFAALALIVILAGIEAWLFFSRRKQNKN